MEIISCCLLVFVYFCVAWHKLSRLWQKLSRLWQKLPDIYYISSMPGNVSVQNDNIGVWPGKVQFYKIFEIKYLNSFICMFQGITTIFMEVLVIHWPQQKRMDTAAILQSTVKAVYLLDITTFIIIKKLRVSNLEIISKLFVKFFRQP